MVNTVFNNHYFDNMSTNSVIWLVCQAPDVCLCRRVEGYGVAWDVWLFVSLAVCPRFVSGADLGNPSAAFFYNAYTHSLEGVDVPIGVYELRPT